MNITANDDVTVILSAIEHGEEDAVEKLLPLVYAELRMLARQEMNRERSDHTLQATALVHEVYMRLLGGRELGWANRRHFFNTAAEAMRRILIEHARKRGRVKRGGRLTRVSLDGLELAVGENPDFFLLLDDAIRRQTACRRSSVGPLWPTWAVERPSVGALERRTGSKTYVAHGGATLHGVFQRAAK